MRMMLLVAGVLFAAAFAGVGEASAAGGCGPSFHRNAYGECVGNRGVVVVPGAPVLVERPIVVERPRACPYGFVWRYGRCRPI